MTPSPLIATAPRRPLVVIVGWMGCRPRQLRRYENLYARLGFRVKCEIPTPTHIIKSTFAQPLALTVPRAWPHGYHQSTTTSESSVRSSNCSDNEELAWKILGELDALVQFPFVFFHIFSNGGCFLWEKLSAILHLADNDGDDDIRNPPASNHVPGPVLLRLAALRERMAGVVFDSCPGSDLFQLPQAMSHCSAPERVYSALTTRYAWFSLPSNQREIKARQEQYMEALLTDSWDLPHLYLCSKNDSLAPYLQLETLVKRRQQLHLSKSVSLKMWNESGHCAHLYHHPTEYEAEIDRFVQTSLKQRLEAHKPRSRL